LAERESAFRPLAVEVKGIPGRPFGQGNVDPVVAGGGGEAGRRDAAEGHQVEAHVEDAHHHERHQHRHRNPQTRLQPAVDGRMVLGRVGGHDGQHSRSISAATSAQSRGR